MFCALVLKLSPPKKYYAYIEASTVTHFQWLFLPSLFFGEKYCIMQSLNFKACQCQGLKQFEWGTSAHVLWATLNQGTYGDTLDSHPTQPPFPFSDKVLKIRFFTQLSHGKTRLYKVKIMSFVKNYCFFSKIWDFWMKNFLKYRYLSKKKVVVFQHVQKIRGLLVRALTLK